MPFYFFHDIKTDFNPLNLHHLLIIHPKKLGPFAKEPVLGHVDVVYCNRLWGMTEVKAYRSGSSRNMKYTKKLR